MSRGHISELLIGLLFLFLTIVFLVSVLSSAELIASIILLLTGAGFLFDYFWIRNKSNKKK